MCFAREENAIIRKSQNQKHRPSTRRNMQALPPRRVTCCNGRKQIESIKPWRKAGKKVQGFQKGARQPKSRKPLRNRQSQNCLKDRRVPNMENRRGPLNRRIKKIFLFAAIEFWRQLYIYICFQPPQTSKLKFCWNSPLAPVQGVPKKPVISGVGL